jgi:transposase-like protein
MPDGSNTLQGALEQAKRGPGRPRKLRTPENAQAICSMIEQGLGIVEIARRLGFRQHSSITDWIRDDREKNGGAGIAVKYARAQEARWASMADEILALADDRSYMGRPDAAAIVQQQRLAVDTRKWLLSKMLPRQFGDKIEISGDPDAPVVSRIELVAVHPPQRQVEPPTIEGKKADDDG